MSLSEQALQGTLSTTALLELLLKLGVVVGLIYLSAWAWRRWGGKSPALAWNSPLAQTPLRVVQVQRLTAQHTVHLLELEGRRLLVATSPQGTQLLSEWPSSSGDTPDV